MRSTTALARSLYPELPKRPAPIRARALVEPVIDRAATFAVGGAALRHVDARLSVMIFASVLLRVMLTGRAANCGTKVRVQRRCDGRCAEPAICAGTGSAENCRRRSATWIIARAKPGAVGVARSLRLLPSVDRPTHFADVAAIAGKPHACASSSAIDMPS